MSRRTCVLAGISSRQDVRPSNGVSCVAGCFVADPMVGPFPTDLHWPRPCNDARLRIGRRCRSALLYNKLDAPGKPLPIFVRGPMRRNGIRLKTELDCCFTSCGDIPIASSPTWCPSPLPGRRGCPDSVDAGRIRNCGFAIRKLPVELLLKDQDANHATNDGDVGDVENRKQREVGIA